MEKDAEILSVGKIAESSRFAERKRLKSQDRFSLIRATASYRSEEGVSLLIPCAHRASLLTAMLAEVLHGLLCAARALASLLGSACSP